jgi:3-oxoacyl-[acyl-carrier-protein] synthase II
MSNHNERATSGRAVITGMGAVTPVGKSVPEMWDSLLKEKSGIGLISQFDTGMIPCKVGAEVPDWIAEEQVGKRTASETDRFIQYTMVAAAEALRDSGLNLDGEDRERIGVVMGNTIGGMPNITRQQEKITAEGRVRLSPHFVTSMMPNMAAGHLSVIHGLHGPNMTLTTACSSGADSIGTAMMLIRTGRADILLAGGTESIYCTLILGGLGAARALSTNNDPASACCPFDLRRDGMVMGEGAGVVVVESQEHALRRGAAIHGEVLGYWNCCDGNHVTAPSTPGQVYCMRQALRDAGVEPGAVNYINAHGTATPLGDKTETASIKEVFGSLAYNIPVSSTKAATGHMLGAAGTVEAIICLKAMEKGILPPTLNLEKRDPECDLDYVPGRARAAQINVALSNSFGFGGQNATLVLGRLSR